MLRLTLIIMRLVVSILTGRMILMCLILTDGIRAITQLLMLIVPLSEHLSLMLRKVIWSLRWSQIPMQICTEITIIIPM